MGAYRSAHDTFLHTIPLALDLAIYLSVVPVAAAPTMVVSDHRNLLFSQLGHAHPRSTRKVLGCRHRCNIERDTAASPLGTCSCNGAAARYPCAALHWHGEVSMYLQHKHLPFDYDIGTMATKP